MSERVRWITHRGEPILLSDFSGLNEERYLEELDETIALLRSAIEMKPPYLLALTDISNTTTTAKITARSKACGALLKGVRANTAVVGATKTKAVIARIVSPNLRVFHDADRAKDWLVSQTNSSRRV